MGDVWFAPDDPSLPVPWKGVVDGATRCLYYWNPETNITQYEKPASWVSSPFLAPSCYPPPFTASNYTFLSQYPNLYSNHQAPAETVINGYTFPKQFPFPNHSHTSTNQLIYPQSQSMVEPIYPQLPSFQPESDMNPLVPTFQSPYDSNPSVPIFVPQLQFSDPEPSSSFLPKGDYEPQSTPVGLNAVPDLAVQTTDMDHSTATQSPNGSSIHPSTDFEDMPTPQLTCSHLQQAANFPEVSEIEKEEPISLLSGFKYARQEYTPTILRDEQSSMTHFPVEPVQTVALWKTAISTNYAYQQACDHRLLEKLCTHVGGLRTLNIKFEVFASLFHNSHFLRALSTLIVRTTPDLVLPSAMLPDSISPLMLNCSYPPNEPSCQPHSLAYELGPLTIGEETLIELWDGSGGLRPMNCKFKVFASLFDNCHFLRTASALLLKNMDTYGTNSNILSEHDSAFTRVNHASFLHFGYERKNLHIPGWFEEIQRNAELLIDESWKDWKQYILTGILVDQFHDNKLNMSFFRKFREPDKKHTKDAFFSLEIFVSSVNSKFLFAESSKGGDISIEKAMEETFLQTTALKVVISTTCKQVLYLVLVLLQNVFVSSATISGARVKQLSYASHLVEALATVTVGHTIFAAVALQIFEAVIVHKLQLGLSTWVVVLPFVVVIKTLLVMEINSNGLITASIEDFHNMKLVVCSLITTATSIKFWAHFISLEKSKLDGQLNLLVLCIFRMELQLMGKFCIVHTSRKQPPRSHFLVHLKNNSGVIYFTILEQFKKTYGVICFVLLVEGYLLKYLLYSKDKITKLVTLKHKKEALDDIGSVAFIGASLVLFQHSHFAGEAKLNDVVEFPKDSMIENVLATFWLCGVFSLSSLNADWVPHLFGLIEMWFKVVIGDLELHFAKESNITRTGEIATGFIFHSGAAWSINNSDISMDYSTICLPHLQELFIEIFAVGLLPYCYSMDTDIIWCSPLWDLTFGQPSQPFKFSVQLDFQVTTVLMDMYLKSHGSNAGLLIFTRYMTQKMFGNCLPKFSHHRFLQMAMTLLYHYMLGCNSVNYVLLLVNHHFGVDVKCGTLTASLSTVGQQLYLDVTLLLSFGSLCNEMAYKDVSLVTLATDWGTVKTHVLDTKVSTFFITTIVGKAWALLCIFKIPEHIITRNFQGLLSSVICGLCTVIFKRFTLVSTIAYIWDVSLAVDTPTKDMITKADGHVIFDAFITFNMLPSGSCGYWDAKVAFGFHDGMLTEGVKSPENLIPALFSCCCSHKGHLAAIGGHLVQFLNYCNYLA